MEPDLLRRVFNLPEPDVSGDGRTVTGLAVPYNVETAVRDLTPSGLVTYREAFITGSFNRAIKAPNRVTYVYGHSDGFGDRLGFGREFRESREGLVAILRLDASRAEAARDAISSSHGALSIGFASIDPRPYSERDGDLVVRRSVRLVHIAAVPQGAYANAVVGSIRQEIDADLAEADAAEAEAAQKSREETERLLAEVDQMVAGQAEWMAKLAPSNGDAEGG